MYTLASLWVTTYTMIWVYGLGIRTRAQALIGVGLSVVYAVFLFIFCANSGQIVQFVVRLGLP